MSSRSVDETRRDFLLRLARGASLAAPVVLTLRAEEARAQGKGSAAAQQAAAATSALGGLSPATTAVQSQPAGTEQLAPWDPAAATQPAPWERPPPTSSGG